MKQQWAEDIKRFFKGRIRQDEPLCAYTHYKIGGPADLYLLPRDLEDVRRIFRYAHEKGIPRFIIGAGSNLLVSDAGFRGIVINLKNAFHNINITEDIISVDSGVGIDAFLDYCSQNHRGGLEFLAGIPGTIGGALTMNAGAFGGETFDHLLAIEIMTMDGRLQVVEKKDINFGYRQGWKKTDSAIVRAKFQLPEMRKEDSKARKREFLNKRRQRQPLDLPSAGSVFKRPPGHYAGKLIEEAGCKGLRVGDAMVSEKHANFIVNLSQATAQDVLKLIAIVRERVFKTFGVELELEIELIGF